MLGDVGRGTAVFPAERQALQQPQQHQRHRRRDPDRCVAGEQADREGRPAHDAHGDQKRVLAAHQIAQPPENQRAERAHGEAGGKRGQRENKAGDFIHAGEELRTDDARQQTVQIEVVPFEHGAEG